MALQFFKSNAVAILYPRFMRNVVAERNRRGAKEQINANLRDFIWRFLTRLQKYVSQIAFRRTKSILERKVSWNNFLISVKTRATWRPGRVGHAPHFRPPTQIRPLAS